MLNKAEGLVKLLAHGGKVLIIMTKENENRLNKT